VLRDVGAGLAAAIGDRPVVVTHGNGPQVGRLVAATEALGRADPLDVLDAATQGELGFLLVEELSARLGARDVVGVLTRVEVDPDDPAFGRPSKPIGGRRLVASPEPVAVPELRAIGVLLGAGAVVVAAGGGGIPVGIGSSGRAVIEAVVDKDLTSALIAVGLDADRLVILTDVDAVLDPDDDRPLGRVPATELDPTRFEVGTMRPKVDAVCRYVRATGRPAAIGALAQARDVVAGTAGTQVVP
jgi:carbamate kinase